MDSITQFTLGAAVGEAVLGRKAGNKAPMWGAILGIVPDLDILANPFLNEVQQIIAHRGITHSILFAVLAPPVFGWLLSRLKWNRTVDWKDWSWLVFWVIATHIFIDVCTSYGTQVFQPFSNQAVSFNSIFIVDPLYTLPLMIGIGSALFFKRNHRRRWANYLGLGISSLYLIIGFGLKWHVNSVFEQNLEQQGIEIDRYMTTPAPLTVFLWTGYAESGDRIYAGLYSVFDDDRQITFSEIPQHSSLIAPYREDLALQRLLWFSNGYYTIQQQPDALVFTDLRFGRSDYWLFPEDAPFVWNYRLEFNTDSSRVNGFQQIDPAFDTRRNLFGRLMSRIFGD